jgi:hypothetical protein
MESHIKTALDMLEYADLVGLYGSDSELRTVALLVSKLEMLEVGLMG